jgi:hypothetical protein
VRRWDNASCLGVLIDEVTSTCRWASDGPILSLKRSMPRRHVHSIGICTYQHQYHDGKIETYLVAIAARLLWACRRTRSSRNALKCHVTPTTIHNGQTREGKTWISCLLILSVIQPVVCLLLLCEFSIHIVGHKDVSGPSTSFDQSSPCPISSHHHGTTWQDRSHNGRR